MTDLKALRCDGRRCSLSTEAWRVVSNTKAPKGKSNLVISEQNVTWKLQKFKFKKVN
jgi:hypothetical protein